MLGISRSSAYSLFLPIILVVVTKCKLLVDAINSIPWANVLFADALSLEGHEIHVAMGNYIAVDACIHGLCHTLRWADQVHARLRTPCDARPPLQFRGTNACQRVFFLGATVLGREFSS